MDKFNLIMKLDYSDGSNVATIHKIVDDIKLSEAITEARIRAIEHGADKFSVKIGEILE